MATSASTTQTAPGKDLPYTFVSGVFDVGPGGFLDPAVHLDRAATIEASFRVQNEEQPIDCVLMTDAQAEAFRQGGREYLDGSAVMGKTAGTIVHEVPQGDYRLIVDYSGAFETTAPFPSDENEITVDVTGTVTA